MSLFDYIQKGEKLCCSLEFRYAKGYCFFRSLSGCDLKYWGRVFFAYFLPSMSRVGSCFRNLCQTKTTSLVRHESTTLLAAVSAAEKALTQHISYPALGKL